MKYTVRAVSIVALAYALGTLLLASVPAWRWLPTHLHPLSAAGCPSGPTYLRLASERPDLGVLPIVMASEGHRGEETASSAQSCDAITKAVRAEQPMLELVPQRFICRSVRKWAREQYQDAGHWIGAPLWLVDGEVVGPAGYDALLADLGLRYERRGVHVVLE